MFKLDTISETRFVLMNELGRLIRRVPVIRFIWVRDSNDDRHYHRRQALHFQRIKRSGMIAIKRISCFARRRILCPTSFIYSSSSSSGRRVLVDENAQPGGEDCAGRPGGRS
jgi:hypothetical protein